MPVFRKLVTFLGLKNNDLFVSELGEGRYEPPRTACAFVAACRDHIFMWLTNNRVSNAGVWELPTQA